MYDLPRGGAPPKLTEADTEIIGKVMKEHPDSPKIIPAEGVEKTCEKFSMSSSERVMKKPDMRRKRVGKTVGKERDPEKYGKSPKETEKYEEQRKAGISDLYFPDQSGFSPGISVPYAYQPAGETSGIPSSGGGRPDVTGFHSEDNRTESFCSENTVHAGAVSVCSDGFSETLIKKTYVFTDNSPIYHSGEFGENFPKWRKRKSYIRYSPPYSPELNPAETVRKFIKQYRKPVPAYISYEKLVNPAEYVLKNTGSEFRIGFGT